MWGQHTRAPSQNCSYPHLLRKRYFTQKCHYCNTQPGLLRRYAPPGTPLRGGQRELLAACCSHLKARWEPLISHFSFQCLLQDLTTPHSPSISQECSEDDGVPSLSYELWDSLICWTEGWQCKYRSPSLQKTGMNLCHSSISKPQLSPAYNPDVHFAVTHKITNTLVVPSPAHKWGIQLQKCHAPSPRSQKKRVALQRAASGPPASQMHSSLSPLPCDWNFVSVPGVI